MKATGSLDPTWQGSHCPPPPVAPIWALPTLDCRATTHGQGQPSLRVILRRLTLAGLLSVAIMPISPEARKENKSLRVNLRNWRKTMLRLAWKRYKDYKQFPAVYLVKTFKDGHLVYSSTGDDLLPRD